MSPERWGRGPRPVATVPDGAPETGEPTLLEGLRAVLALSLAADRGRSLATVAMFGLRPLGQILTVVFLAALTDAADRGDTAAVWAYAVAGGVAAGTTALVMRTSLNVCARLVEQTSSYVDLRLQNLAHRMPGIEHYERPDYLDRLELLRQERPRLTEGVDVVALEIGVLVRLSVTAILLGSISPWLLLLPLVSVVSLVAARRAERIRQDGLAHAAVDLRRARDLFAVAASPSASLELRVFGVGGRLEHLHRDSGRRARTLIEQAAWRGLGLVVLGWLVFSAGYVLALLLVLTSYRSGTASTGQVVLALILLTSINLQITMMVRYTSALLRTVRAGVNYRWLEQVSAPGGSGDGKRRPPGQLDRGMELAGVTFGYDRAPGSAVLRDIDLILPAGQVIALVGENGAGKSTLVKLLSGFYRPVRGAVRVDGVDLAEIDPQAWRSRLTATFQDFSRLEFTLQQTVGVGDLPRLGDPDRVLGALGAAGAAELVESVPEGLGTRLGDSFTDGVGLSGGQWQSVAVARSAMRERPLLVILDEPTSAIDPVAEEVLLDRYVGTARALARTTGAIVVIVSHRLSTVRKADLIVFLEKGRIREQGRHQDLLDRQGGYAELYQVQAHAYR
ncbi:ABC transporter ATP-binding protein [Kineosporia sp. NBRC 101731]|uniref:ATP-binding cassette domain-containing protein n=1 Tax=Kineosporia sp. NBRC 101731 TaxID=3032199 RepID=UPI0024A1960B|nr:ABC transporter ATP-binding protein [Kineosporia sp. NBRC 101731]GLY30843.1 ABC transporter permease [Kineosporia sp. NBRC 101731]